VLGAWSRVTVRAVGGLTEIGFSADEQLLLLVSWQRRGLIDTRSGQKVATNSQEPSAASTWRREQDLTVLESAHLTVTAAACRTLGWVRLSIGCHRPH